MLKLASKFLTAKSPAKLQTCKASRDGQLGKGFIISGNQGLIQRGRDDYVREEPLHVPNGRSISDPSPSFVSADNTVL